MNKLFALFVVIFLSSFSYGEIKKNNQECNSSKNISLQQMIVKLQLPLVLTPNGDNINDVFKIKHNGIRKLESFEIFDRWGSRVFYTNDLNAGWDGKKNGRLMSMDNYSYLIIATSYDGERITKQGSFTLIW